MERPDKRTNTDLRSCGWLLQPASGERQRFPQAQQEELCFSCIALWQHLQKHRQTACPVMRRRYRPCASAAWPSQAVFQGDAGHQHQITGMQLRVAQTQLNIRRPHLLPPGHPNLTEGEVRSHLGGFGLGRLAVSPIRRYVVSLVFGQFELHSQSVSPCTLLQVPVWRRAQPSCSRSRNS